MALPIDAASRMDATEELVGPALTEGDNEISAQSPSGLRLITNVAPGRRITYRIVDAGGNAVSEFQSMTLTETTVDPASGVAKSETTCWECGVDAQGNRHCWKVPCPDIVGPWDGTSIKDVLIK